MAQVVGIVGSETTRGAQCDRLGEDDVVSGSGTASWAWGRGRWQRVRASTVVGNDGAGALGKSTTVCKGHAMVYLWGNHRSNGHK
jgi:hypothetical protein